MKKARKGKGKGKGKGKEKEFDIESDSDQGDEEEEVDYRKKKEFLRRLTSNEDVKIEENALNENENEEDKE